MHVSCPVVRIFISSGSTDVSPWKIYVVPTVLLTSIDIIMRILRDLITSQRTT